MTIKLYQLSQGVPFLLNRTGKKFTMLRRDKNQRGHTVIVVKRDGEDGEITLHRSCHVTPIVES